MPSSLRRRRLSSILGFMAVLILPPCILFWPYIHFLGRLVYHEVVGNPVGFGVVDLTAAEVAADPKLAALFDRLLVGVPLPDDAVNIGLAANDESGPGGIESFYWLYFESSEAGVLEFAKRCGDPYFPNETIESRGFIQAYGRAVERIPRVGKIRHAPRIKRLSCDRFRGHVDIDRWCVFGFVSERAARRGVPRPLAPEKRQPVPGAE